MKKTMLMCFAVLMAFLSSTAQEQKAKNILDQVSEKTRSYKTISADFTFTMNNDEMDIHEKNEGSIKLKGQKYVVTLPDVGMKIYSDGNTVWNYMEDGNQVTISSIDNEESDLMNPSSLFHIYEKGYQSKYVGEKTQEGKTVYEIELFPDEEQQDVSKINILIGKADMMIDSATLYTTDGNLYGIEIKTMKTNLDIPDSSFTFDPSKHRDVEIIDFR